MVSSLVAPVLDCIQNKLDEKEVFLKGAHSEEFGNLFKSVTSSQSEIIRLIGKCNRNISELDKVDNKINIGRDKYLKVSNDMEKAIHKFVCIKDGPNNKTRRNTLRKMIEK